MAELQLMPSLEDPNKTFLIVYGIGRLDHFSTQIICGAWICTDIDHIPFDFFQSQVVVVVGYSLVQLM